MTPTLFPSLRRPRLLSRAARYGVPEYDRRRVLPRILDAAIPNDHHAVISALVKTEAAIEADRTSNAATYSIPRHIEVLIALMGEMRAMSASDRAA